MHCLWFGYLKYFKILWIDSTLDDAPCFKYSKDPELAFEMDQFWIFFTRCFSDIKRQIDFNYRCTLFLIILKGTSFLLVLQLFLWIFVKQYLEESNLGQLRWNTCGGKHEQSAVVTRFKEHCSGACGWRHQQTLVENEPFFFFL